MPERTDARTTPTTDTMLAMVRDRYGPAAEVLAPRRVPIPAVERNEVLVNVRFSSVNAMEWHLMNGKPYLLRPAFGLTPRSGVLGADMAGVVAIVGPEVTRFRPGDEVFGDIDAGAYAEYATAREDQLAHKPPTVSFEDAAAIPVAGLTALQGLRDVIGVHPGDRVLINGASGGVGTYAVQIAKVLGAHVTGVCSSRNVEMATSLGADVVVDYEHQDFTSTSERYDVVFDGPGNRPLRAMKRLLAPGGTYVMVGGPKGSWTGPVMRILGAAALFLNGDRKTTTFTASGRSDDVADLGALLSPVRFAP